MTERSPSGRRRRFIVVLAFAISACSDPKPPSVAGAGGFPESGGTGSLDCDHDEDGVAAESCGGADCDDADAATYAGAAEICGDGRDNDCDRTADDGCACAPGDLRACWEGLVSARGVGACRDGVQRCGPDSTYGACTGAVLPEPEAPGCDGIDEDCDGSPDPQDACPACAPDAVEICGNGLDDDCSGTIDDPDVCTLDCSQVNPRSADRSLACCSARPRAVYEFECHTYGGLAPCDDRPCLDLDPDDGLSCGKICKDGGCWCGASGPDGDPVASPACGFLSPCARVDCDGRQHQPCYSGPPATLGVGACHGGFHSCVEGGGSRAWDACDGEQLPAPEACGNGLDDDCDGAIDESDALGRTCLVWPGCDPGAPERCGNGLDDDCDGFADEACKAPPGATQACWTGPLLARGLGACLDGTQTEAEGTWGPCVGAVLPATEHCGDHVDSDCNGLGAAGSEDPSCCVGSTETCNGVDDDCDGLVDDGVLPRCGVCGDGCGEDLSIEELPDCDRPGRTCERVGPFELDAAAITVVPSDDLPRSDLLYALGDYLEDGHAHVLQVDVVRGELLHDFDLGEGIPFEVTASVDGSFWVGIDRPGGDVLEHHGEDGSLLCKAEIVEFWGVGADPSGDVWLDHRRGEGPDRDFVRRINPRCSAVDLLPGDAATDLPITQGGRPVVDALDRVWVAYANSAKPVHRFDGLFPGMVTTLDVPFRSCAVSAGAFGVSSGIIGPDEALYCVLARFDGRAPESGRSSIGNPPYLWSYGRDYEFSGIDVASDGGIWAIATETPELALLDPVSGAELTRIPIPGGGVAAGIALDSHERVWIQPAVGRNLLRFDPPTQEWLPVDAPAISIERGATSRPMRELMKRRGLFTQLVDPGIYDVRWDELFWTASTPALTRAYAMVRFADDVADLDGTDFVCGPFETSPADVSVCSGGRRHARVELHLAGTGRPAVRDVRISWHRP